MKVSIITVCLNSEKTIETCIKSILRQSYEYIELVVIDGDSADNTVLLLTRLLPKSSVLISEKDTGLYNALNKGIQNCTGDIIGIMHSDDFFSHDYAVEDIVKEFRAPTVDATYGDLLFVDKNDGDTIVRKWKSNEFTFKLLRKGWMPPHPTLYIRRSSLGKIGFYDERFMISSDYDFILRLFSQKNFVCKYIPKTIVSMRTGGKSNQSLSNIIIKIVEDYKVIKKNEIGGILTLVKKNFSKLPQLFKILW